MFSRQFVGTVVIGSINPRILNHDFLINNDILPKVEPFKAKPNGDPPFSNYIATPVMTTITYEHLSILADASRFQITDYKLPPEKNLNNEIAEKYFKILAYTPMRMVGFNLNGLLTYKDDSEQLEFEKHLGINHEALYKIMTVSKIDLSGSIKADWEGGSKAIALAQDPISRQPGINLNCEFPCDDFSSLKIQLAKYEKVYHEFSRLLRELGIEVNK